MTNELTADQISADKLIEHWFFKESRQLFALAGFAGTGKTTLLKYTVTQTLKLVAGDSAAFVTPTGKAATVLIKGGIPATTLHRLIYQTLTEKVEIELNGKTIQVERPVFRRRESIDKSIKLIVLDEASMVSDDVLFDILNFGVKVLICGDNAQLPPVEGFSTYLSHADFTLRQIVRQQADNPIITLARLAREGMDLPYGHYADRAFVLSRRDFFGERRRKFLLKATQVICGINKTRAKINEEIRGYLGFGELPQNGDKLICTHNNWCEFIDEAQTFNLVNGIIGRAIDPICEIDKRIGFTQFIPDFLDEPCPNVLPFDTGIFTDGAYAHKIGDYFEKFDENGDATDAFTLNRFEYGYCISCHKAQGSEFDSAIIFDESYAFREEKARWLYTAITRAKNKLIIVR